MSTLAIRLTRLSPTHHRFEAIRADGTRVARELETRSFLLHDLVHFEVESEAAMRSGFYGRLARGEDDGDLSGEALVIERVVGALQGASKGEPDPAAFVTAVTAHCAQLGEDAPAWLTADFIVRVLERLRALNGRWRATPFHEAMELQFKAD